jgi:hypothetical protein
MDNDLLITMTGNLEGDTIKGAVDFGGFAQDEWNAKRATAATAAGSTSVAAAAHPKSNEKVDIAGDWEVALNTPGGGVRNLKATFKLDGEKLTGSIKGERGDLPIEGSVKGKEVKFSYTIKYMDNDLLITMTGNLEGDTIKGAVDFGGFAQDEWNAKRATAATAAGSTSAAAVSNPKSNEKVNITGAWTFQVETQAGSGSPTFTFKQEGEKLTGKYKGTFGEADLTGTVKGDQVEFSIKVSGQIDGTVTYTGTTDGKEMKGKAKFAELGEGTFTGKKQ